MQITKTENNVLTATKRGCVQVFAWIDPEGTVCTQEDTAVASFQSLNITVTAADRKAMTAAVKNLHN